MKKFILFPLFFVLATASTSIYAAACTVTGGVITVPATDCFTEPDYYSITVYEMGLCPSAPTAPTASAAIDVSACQTVFTSTTGASIVVVNGQSSALSGTITNPASGTYTHGYIRIDKTFILKDSSQYSASMNGQSSGSGVFCATTTDNLSNSKTSICAATSQTAGTLTVPLTSFDSPGFTASVSNSTTEGTVTAYLIDATGKLATAAGNVTQLSGVQTFNAPVVITDLTTGMDAAFQVSTGMTIGNNAGTLLLNNGPFSVKLTIQ